MKGWIVEKITADRSAVLDRLILGLGALLVLAIVVFASYYYFDQHSQGDDRSAELEIARLEQEVRDDPSSLNPRLALATLYFADENYAASAEQFRAVLALNAENTLAMVGLGRSAILLGDLNEAMNSFERVISQAHAADVPGDFVAAAYYYLASIALDEGRTVDAISHLRQAVAVDRADADAWYLLGVAYLENGDPDEAIPALTMAVAFVPDYAEAYETLALAYDQNGLTPEATYARGMLAYSMGRYDEAESELEAALDASAELVGAHIGLGLVREVQGQRDLAISSYQQALKIEPDNFNGRAGLSRLGVAAPEVGHGEVTTP